MARFAALGVGRRLGISSSEVFHGGFWEADEASKLLRDEGDRFRPLVWREALAEQGIVDEPLIEKLVSASIEEGTGPHEPYPGTAEVLTGLSLLRPLGVVTNGNSEIQRRKVVRSGLGHFFQTIVVSGDAGLGTAKPDPAPFRRALEEMNVSPQDAVMVGNDPVNDIYGAACVGMRTVWVNRTGNRFPAEIPPDHEIEDLRQLPAVLGLGL